MRSISLIIPGLLPIPAGIEARDLPATPYLSRLLSRSDLQFAPHDYAGILARIAGIDLPLPLANLRYQSDTGQSATQYCLCADPVHLAPGREGMVLFDSGHFSLQETEVAALGATIKPLLKESGYRLETPASSRWYLLSEQPFGITSGELYNVAGGDIGTHLPVQRQWRQLLNELQMLLHDCEVNQTREARGELPINSLWFWGESGVVAPQVQRQARADIWFTDEPIAVGLAAHIGARHEFVADAKTALTAVSASASVRVIVPTGSDALHLDDPARWLDHVNLLETNWCKPLCTALQRNQFQQLVLLLSGAAFRSTPWKMRRFWRRAAGSPLLSL